VDVVKVIIVPRVVAVLLKNDKIKNLKRELRLTQGKAKGKGPTCVIGGYNNVLKVARLRIEAAIEVIFFNFL